MARTLSSTETLASVLERSPSENLVTPAANKPIRIRPLKRARGKENVGETGEVESRSPSPTPPVDPEAKVQRPRRLNFDDEKVVKVDEPSPVEKEEEEEEEVPLTQPWPPGQREEGELTPEY